MSIISKVKSAVKKAATYTYNTVNSIANTVKGTVSDGLSKIGRQTAAVGNALGFGTQTKESPPSSSVVKDILTYQDQSGLAGDSGNNMSNKTIVGMTKATGANAGKTSYSNLMTAAPQTVSSGTKVKSNYSSPSYGTDLAALSASNFMTGGPISTTVNASSLSSQSSSTGIGSSIPSAPSATNYQGTAIGGNVAVGADPSTGLMPTPSVTATSGTATGDQAPKEDATSTYQKAMERLFKQKDTSEEAYLKAQKESGILQAQQQMQNTQNAINGITSKMNADLLQLRGTAAQEGVTEAVYGGQQAQITREATIKLLPLQAQLAADQGNLEMAESNLDTLFKIYSKDAQDSYDFYAGQAKTIYDKATDAEKRQLDANMEKIKYEQGITDDWMKWQRDMMSKSMTENPRLYNALKQIIPPTNGTSPTYKQDQQNFIADLMEAGGQYGAQSNIAGTGADAPLYAGLNPATATAVRQQVSTFKTEPAVQNFVTIQEGRNFAKSLSDTTKNPVDDQGLIYSLAKALDPGSVVREGEYATAQKYAQSWVSAYGKGVSQALAGTGFLSEAARKNIKATIEAKYNASTKTYDNVLNQYKNGINNLTGRSDGDKFLRDYKITDSSGGDIGNDPLGIF